MILEGLRLNPDDPLEFATVALTEYQIGFFAYAELARRELNRSAMLQNDFWTMSFVQFSNSADRNTEGAEIMRSESVRRISKAAWARLPRDIRDELKNGSTRIVKDAPPNEAA